MSPYLVWGINMYRKKSKVFHSILFRISVWILVIGLTGILLVNYFVRMRMRIQLENQITEELLRVRNNCFLCVRQTLLLNEGRLDSRVFELYGDEIEEMLKNAGYREIFLCDGKGELLCGDGARFGPRQQEEDFKRALEGDSVFVIHYGLQEQCKVFFSMPVMINGQNAGIISCAFDYGELYRGQQNIIRQTTGIIIGAFALICLVIWLTVYQILLPIRRLSRGAAGVSACLTDGRQGSMILEELGFQRRRDEIGELASNYLEMLRVIEDQIGRISEDKERIVALWNSRQEFYNNVTHELKTPLTTISGYAQLMEKNGPQDEKLFYMGTEHIIKESSRLHRMVVQLLELQDKADDMRPEQLDLGELLKNVTETMGIKARRYENELVLEADEDQCFLVLGQEDRIRQVFINVIDNAIKYGERGKPVQIRIRRQEGRICTTVMNWGRGIPKEDLEKIFEPFYRVDKGFSRELGSSGLGLSIAARIMEEHGGHISADSAAEGGTVFTVWFPAGGYK